MALLNQLASTGSGRSGATRVLLDVLRLVVGVLIIRVTFAVLRNYPDYLPPNFSADFLLGREAYFFGSYQWAFYAHIVSGPLTLIIGLALMSERFRRRFPAWHRVLGRIQVVCVLLLVTPSGFWMAFHAQAGAVAGVGFAALAFATGLCACCGWRSAVRRRFTVHRRWMSRCYLLLCSAVVLRLTAGLFTVTGVEADWTYPLTAWTSWLVPLAIYEAFQTFSRLSRSRFSRRHLSMVTHT
ncbi:MAG: DUF2306 domain-containing protein [Planctomycetaceae bacterium]|nr:DUF2306 domain-containing protein [Planctomycetaceae bacterium]